jgi:putative oxidoreductase
MPQNIPVILMIYSDFGILALRLALGVILLAHGIPKAKDIRGAAEWFASVGFRPGRLWATVAAVTECAGGVLLLAGAFVQYAAFVVAGQFAVILFWRLRRRDTLASAELELLVFAAALALTTLGGGTFQLIGI